MNDSKRWAGPVLSPPDFANLLKVLRRERPDRPTLFEFFLNAPLYYRLSGPPDPRWPAQLTRPLTGLRAFRNAGYDYATVQMPGFSFAVGDVQQAATRSLNQGTVISDRASFDAYVWPDMEKVNYGMLDRLAENLPTGMKLIVCGPCGVLENTIRLVGFETLCYLILDDEKLAFDVFEGVGSRLLKYYARCVQHPAVGAIIGNDDWGFKSQTMLSPADMRRFVFPWHREIVAVAHAAGKPAILHSCGYLGEVMDDIVDDMRYDGKHSFEDVIQPVEEAYEQYHGRIAILGGIDLDFVTRSSPEDVYRRSRAMLERAAGRGGYALGTGNSVPEYVPHDNYFAMIAAATESR